MDECRTNNEADPAFQRARTAKESAEVAAFKQMCENLSRGGPAAHDYRNAHTEEDLWIAAGKHLCFHATAIMRSLPLPKRGSLVLKAMKKLTPTRWYRFYNITYNTFCACALVDLREVRSRFQRANRWPELAPLVKQAFIMSCLHYGELLSLDQEEKDQFQGVSIDHFLQFEDDPSRTSEQQLDWILGLNGLDVQKIRKPEFIRKAVIELSHLEPFQLMKEYDRIKSSQ